MFKRDNNYVTYLLKVTRFMRTMDHCSSTRGGRIGVTD